MDFWTWVERRALQVVIAAYAVIIVLQFAFFSGGMDIVTSLFILVLLLAIAQVRRIEAWWKGMSR